MKAEALKVASQYKLGPLFTPPIVKGEGDKQAMVYVPNGANWPGGSFDPETGILYVFSNTLTRAISLVNDAKRSDMDYVNGAGGGDTGGGLTVQGLPLVKPPWGRITALDLNKGEIVWQVAHGETLDSVTNHPMLKGITIPRTGRIGPIGTLTTKTLVISGESGFTALGNGQRGAILRRVRQGDRCRRRGSDDARATDGIADDVLARRQAVPGRRDQRCRLPRGADRVHAAEVSSLPCG
ncbi:MAG: hypothetical protein QM736_00680 [Vicinamibacterales bacterium]